MSRSTVSRRAVLKVLGASSVASLTIPACGGYDLRGSPERVLA